MAQIKKTCSVTNGAPTVTVTGDQTARIKANTIFMVDTELVPYFVAINSTYSAGADLTTVTLTGNYQGPTNTTATGVFSVDATYPNMIPTIAQGDVGTAAVFTAAMNRIQTLLTAADNSVLPITKYFQSADQTVTPAALYTLAHGMGAAPKLVQAYLKCMTAEFGYAVGDTIPADIFTDMSVTSDATNLSVRMTSASTPLAALNKTTGATVTLTNANWKFFIRAYA
jgi:hypothetical protein